MKTALNNNKKSKYRNLQLKAIATDYLANISLDGNTDYEVKKTYFDKIISNEFDRFLNFNSISADKSKQTEYFKYYKQKLLNENPKLKSARLDTFLKSEFESSNENVKSYIEDILAKKCLKKTDKKLHLVPKVTIIPSQTFENANQISGISSKHTVNDVEADYFQKHAQENIENIKPAEVNESANQNIVLRQCLSSNATISSSSSLSQYSNSYKFSQSLTHALQSISNAKNKIATRISKSPNIDDPYSDMALQSNESLKMNDTQTNDELKRVNTLKSNLKQTRQQRMQRTTSESSTESNYNTLSTNKNFKSFLHYKPGLFNNLKKLNSEKLFLVSNSAPVGIFSRLPFRFNKFDLNESFHKTRHSSIVKATQLNSNKSNHFVNDVFELLDLDFEEYIRQGEMSYSNLIDPVSHSKQKYFRRTATSNDESDQGCIIEKQEEADLKEKDDLISNETNIKQAYNNSNIKKETNPFLIAAYQPDYLDDPQLTELTAGKNRTCLKFPSYAVSIIDYVKPLDLKKEINETFKEKFPFIQISLTKLRSIKREMLEIGAECSLDAIIVAQSYIYFEQLILRGLINKTNRKLLAANCLLIAAKLNDITKKDISKLIDIILNKFRFDNKKEIISHEFPILVALEFNLMIKYETDFISHYERILNNSDYVKYYERNHFSKTSYD